MHGLLQHSSCETVTLESQIAYSGTKRSVWASFPPFRRSPNLLGPVRKIKQVVNTRKLLRNFVVFITVWAFAWDCGTRQVYRIVGIKSTTVRVVHPELSADPPPASAHRASGGCTTAVLQMGEKYLHY